mgnify:CR=1 FL=1
MKFICKTLFTSNLSSFILINTLLIFIFASAQAQSVVNVDKSTFSDQFKNNFQNHVIYKENYVLEESTGLNKVVVPFHFDKTKTEFRSDSLLKINPKKIRSVEYIYYTNKDKKYQANLNASRMDTLLSLYKNRFKSAKGAHYSTVILSSEHPIRTQFTGFVISYEKSTKENFEVMRAIIDASEDAGRTSCFELDTLKEYGYVLPHFDPNFKAKEINTVASVMMGNPSWDNIMVVDVTGSMTPYVSQYMQWLRLKFNERENQCFVFFNDGNDNIRRGKSKKIGSTGGIYTIGNSYNHYAYSFNKIRQTLEKAMMNGGGGDCPENNIEALLLAEQKNPYAKNIVMVADNFATPRDMKLVKKLTKPVNVILCGVKGGNVNTAYMDLAFKTNGSIHTMEQSLNELYKLKEGEEFDFMGKMYVVKKDGIKTLDSVEKSISI